MSIKTTITVALMRNTFLTTTQIRWVLAEGGLTIKFKDLMAELDKMAEQGLIEKAKSSNGWKWRLV